MTVVKKTVALHPIMDSYVRKLHAILIDKGWDATYSTALNLMMLYQILDVVERGVHQKVAELLNNFLQDEGTIAEIKQAERVEEYVEENRERIHERSMVWQQPGTEAAVSVRARDVVKRKTVKTV